MSSPEEMRRAGRDSDGPPAFIGRNPRELARIHRTSAETHSLVALELWRGADAFGHVVAAVEAMGNEGWQAIADEESAADKIVIDGPEIIRALRALAMRLDRAVTVKASGDE